MTKVHFAIMNQPPSTTAAGPRDLQSGEPLTALSTLVKALNTGKAAGAFDATLIAPDVFDHTTIQQLDAQGLLPWVRWRLARHGHLKDLAQPLQQQLNHASRALAVQELGWDEELAALGDLAASYPMLVFKGSDLATRVYPQGALRPRCDIDLLVNKRQFKAVTQTLLRRGYEQHNTIDAPLVSRQAAFTRQIDSGMLVSLDVHWELSNRPALVAALRANRVMERAVPGTGSLQHWRVPSLIDAQLIACLHRIAHHRTDRRWLWLLDIDLLWQRLSVTDRRRFCERAVEIGTGAICADGLSSARTLFETAITDSELGLLTARAQNESSAYLLTAPNHRWADLRFDFRSLPNWRAKANFLRQHLLPNRHYMRAKYGKRGSLMLPYYYLKRLGQGLGKLLRPRA